MPLALNRTESPDNKIFLNILAQSPRLLIASLPSLDAMHDNTLGTRVLEHHPERGHCHLDRVGVYAFGKMLSDAVSRGGRSCVPA